MSSPVISAIICTRDRHALLARALEGLSAQTLDRSLYEVVVIDDGSCDRTAELVGSFSRRLPLRYFAQRPSGLGAARNHGVLATRGELVLFLDDDDVATPTLLEEHLRSHAEHAERNVAVLNRTEWAPELEVTPLMEYVTEVGCFLFAYRQLVPGTLLDFAHFWGGRVSCKKLFLLEYGLFDPVFRFGCEDIELAWRLSRAGLRVLYNDRALTHMLRPVGFDDFCERLRRQGRSQWVLSRLHDAEAVRRWAEVEGAERRWREIAPIYDTGVRIARDLDCLAMIYHARGLRFEPPAEGVLHRAYHWAFVATKLRGMVERCEEELSAPGEDRIVSTAPGGIDFRGGYDAFPEAALPLAAALIAPNRRSEAVIQVPPREVEVARQHAFHLERELEAARYEVLALRRSWSWRITAPLRWIFDTVVSRRYCGKLLRGWSRRGSPL